MRTYRRYNGGTGKNVITAGHRNEKGNAMPTGPEHEIVRIPVLSSLLDLGWLRSQIVCPDNESGDKEWRVPKNPSESSKREAGRTFSGFPCDLAIFDSPEFVGDWRHVRILFEFKAPNISEGIAQLETYLGLEPYARMGVWSNGAQVARVYKLSDGTYDEVPHSTLPRYDESVIRPKRTPFTFSDLKVPTEESLRSSFEDMLGGIAATDTVSTRPEQRLNEIANLLMLKIDSDTIGSTEHNSPLKFQLRETPQETAHAINAHYVRYKGMNPDLFLSEDREQIALDPESIQLCVRALEAFNLRQVAPRALSLAFQVFRSANLKIGDGQYYTPYRVVEAGVKMLDITIEDKVIDPACGTGGFLDAAYTTVFGFCSRPGVAETAPAWAGHKLFGVDKDSINIKLTRSLMVGLGDGSTNAIVGDSLRSYKWADRYPRLIDALADESYTVVVTNPPFGKDLKIAAQDGRESNLSICSHTPSGAPSGRPSDTELGIAFVERAWKLLRPGGRLGIVLPETFFFSKSYEYFRMWVEERFDLKGVLNIPMEAFQGFCRAKTNFYVLQKKYTDGELDVHVPSWFKEGKIWVSNAPTIGINKDGAELYLIDESGNRTTSIDDKASQDVDALIAGTESPTSEYVIASSNPYTGVPKYLDRSAFRSFQDFVQSYLPDFDIVSIGELVDRGELKIRTGHGSPSADLRSGEIPYVKVSDLRAGLVNVNRTNMVSRTVAERFWRGSTSQLTAFDVLTPARACKNIGEPAVLLPGQEDLVLTKEILVFSSMSEAFDNFYLAWALSLETVLAQWQRVIFMQTNREDVGQRYREIVIPAPPNRRKADEVSEPSRLYFQKLASLKTEYAAARASQFA